jgi:hypothetical protein
MPKDLTRVNGVAVIARDSAVIESTVAKNGRATLATVDEIILSDGTKSMFQCVHPNAPDCEYVADSPRSVTAHQRAHSASILLKRELKAKNEMTERRRAGAKRGAETRAAKKAAQESGSSADILDDAHYTRMAALDEYDRGCDMIVEGMRVCQTAMDNLAKIPLGDPVTAEKARKWDDLRANLQD